MLAGLGVFGAALFFGDSMITPAISVLSAVEGTETISSSMEHLVIPITLVIIVALFAVQRHGTGPLGRLFGPIMLVWFATIAVLGIRGITMHPEVLEALSPTYAIDFLFGSGSTGFFSLASVVLAITGAEALYADMGHFGRPGDRPRLAAARVPGVHPELPRTGGADPRRPRCDQRALLPADATRRARPAGAPGDGGHGDRVPGRDLGRLLARPPGLASSATSRDCA